MNVFTGQYDRWASQAASPHCGFVKGINRILMLDFRGMFHAFERTLGAKYGQSLAIVWEGSPQGALILSEICGYRLTSKPAR